MIFISRKNYVEFKDGAVVKQYGDRECCKREAQMLKKLKLAGVHVPCILDQTENTLTLEYIDGQIYADIIDHLNAGHARALARHLIKYRRATGLLRGDVNLRNFIYSNGICYGLDFEEPPDHGDIEKDMGSIIAFAVTYDPMLDKNKLNAARLLKAAFEAEGADIKKLEAYYKAEIEAMEKRRGAQFTQAGRARGFWEEVMA